MRKRPTDSPYESGEWSRADLDAYCRNRKAIPVLWGLAVAIALGVLAHMVVRFAGWMGGR